MTEYLPRRAARVLLVDRDGRLLMFHGFDPARPEHPFWFTVGGGLDPGETSAQGAARELREETGLALVPAALGEVVHRDVTTFPFDRVWYRQEQDWYLVRVDLWQVCDDGFEPIERESIDGHRWWGMADLVASGERFYPPDLPELMARLVAA